MSELDKIGTVISSWVVVYSLRFGCKLIMFGSGDFAVLFSRCKDIMNQSCV